jgi:hypothetical protein
VDVEVVVGASDRGLEVGDDGIDPAEERRQSPYQKCNWI